MENDNGNKNGNDNDNCKATTIVYYNNDNVNDNGNGNDNGMAMLLAMPPTLQLASHVMTKISKFTILTNIHKLPSKLTYTLNTNENIGIS